MSTLQLLKAGMQPGALVEITNHYVTREDHPCFGTTLRTITAVNGSSWSYFEPAHGKDHAVKWPLARDVMDNHNGSFAIFGHPKPDDLFLTIRPLGRESVART